jgi:hypothetical protein
VHCFCLRSVRQVELSKLEPYSQPRLRDARLSQHRLVSAFGGESEGWGVVSEAFPGSIVQFGGDEGDGGCRVDGGEVGSLRVVLAREPVEVLVRAALPWTASFGK